MDNEIVIAVAVISAVAVGLLLLKFARQIATLLLAIGGVVAVIAVAWAMLAQSQATRQAAEAATIASAGQTTSSLGVTVLALLLVLAVVGGGVAILYLLYRLRRAEELIGRWEGMAGRWLPGPNARWQRAAPPVVYPTVTQLTGYPLAAQAYYPPPYGYAQPGNLAAAVHSDDDDADLPLPWWGWGS